MIIINEEFILQSYNYCTNMLKTMLRTKILGKKNLGIFFSCFIMFVKFNLSLFVFSFFSFSPKCVDDVIVCERVCVQSRCQTVARYDGVVTLVLVFSFSQRMRRVGLSGTDRALRSKSRCSFVLSGIQLHVEIYRLLLLSTQQHTFSRSLVFILTNTVKLVSR